MFNGFKRCGDANISSVYKYTQEKQIYENVYNESRTNSEILLAVGNHLSGSLHDLSLIICAGRRKA